MLLTCRGAFTKKTALPPFLIIDEHFCGLSNAVNKRHSEMQNTQVAIFAKKSQNAFRISQDVTYGTTEHIEYGICYT